MPNPLATADLARAAEHLGAGRFAAAREAADAVLAKHPGEAEAHHLRGLALFREGRAEDAIDALTSGLELNPDSADMLANLGQMQLELGNFDAAHDCLSAALDMAPDDNELRLRTGLAAQSLSRFGEAETAYREIIRRDPAFVAAHYNLGLTLSAAGRLDDAIAAYEGAAHADPRELSARSAAAQLRQAQCQWAGIDRLRAEIIEPALRGAFSRPPLLLDVLALPVAVTPAEFGTLARSYTRAHGLVSQPRFSPPPRREGGRLRIGYVSGDFGDHPVGHLVGPLISRHDRAGFEVTAYATTGDDGSAERRNLVTGVEKIVDLSRLDPAAAAARIHQDGIDVLIDLHGHTQGNRLEIFAQRPARKQATWLGFPGTTGADFFDAVLADAIAAPAGDQPHYSERLLHLPHAYVAVEPAAGVAPPRSSLDLPETGIVFCAFNAPHKIEPLGFGLWMKLLAETPGSVLWLRADARPAQDNLRREAQARGIDAQRLIFAPRAASRAEHLARQRAADLFLDTIFYNAHATAADALAIGLPVVTLKGGSFAARVGASLLKAAGLEALIAASPDEYLTIARRVAADPGATKAKLAVAQQTAPLFDAARFVGDLETALRKLASS